MKKKTLQLIKKIPGWLEVSEALFLEQAVKSTRALKGEIVEIGSFCGKSTISLAQSNGYVYAIDPHLGQVAKGMNYSPTYDDFIKNTKAAEVFHKIIPLVKTSRQAAKNWKDSIRVLFIDGLHDEKHATLDFNLWIPYVVPGGIVAMHDSFRRWCGSEKVALKKIVYSSDFYKIGVVGSIVYGIKGRGTLLQRLIKLTWQIYISAAIQIDHGIIVIGNVSSIIDKVGLKLQALV